jgi:hypothetical protein
MASTRGVLVIAASAVGVALIAGALLLFRGEKGDSSTIERGPDDGSVDGVTRVEALESPGREREPVRPADVPKEPDAEVVLGEDELIAQNRAKWDAETARANTFELRRMRAALDREVDERARPKLQAMLDKGESQVMPDGGLPAYEEDQIDKTEIRMVLTDLETGRRRAVLPREGNMDLYLLKAKSRWMEQVIAQRQIVDDPAVLEDPK